ncbi:MAG TPA: amidase [Stenomitos sp.]
MSTSPLLATSATDLAAMIRRKALSATELLEAHLAQIQRHNAALNAVVTLDETGAREQARQADLALARGEVWGPLHGVPVTIKDSFETAGIRSTCGHRRFAHHVPDRDATVVTRMKQAGAILLGKTNVPTLAIGYHTVNPVFGPSYNPWSPDRTPGGSTGGGSAAVAAGLSPLEIGTDCGGSLRIPAHFCGVYGFKPTEHRVSTAGHISGLPRSARGLRFANVAGPVARSVRDLDLALSLLEGPDGRHWDVLPAPVEASPTRPLSEVTLAWTEGFGSVRVAGEIRAAIRRLVDRLDRAGATMVERSLPHFRCRDVEWTFGVLAGFELGEALPAIPSLMSRVLTSLSAGAAYRAALERRDALIGEVEQVLSGVEAWICPVASVTAFPAARRGNMLWEAPLDVDGSRVRYLEAAGAHTILFSLSGHPAAVIPLGLDSTGLPVGVQIVGRRWGDRRLLALVERIAELVGPPPMVPQLQTSKP